MRTVSSSYELGGRTSQKQRTRAALVDAARAMVATGLTPTVEAAAEAASISRTTAYRYFPNQRALLAAAHPETAASTLLPAQPPEGSAARLDVVVEAFTRLIVETELQQRTMLRLSLEARHDEHSSLPLRQGRAIGWITEALEPMRHQLTEGELHALVVAIRATTGIEALVWLTDIAGLSRDEAGALMRWSAQALLERATTSPPPVPAQARG
jgi:AcrR family transcriptional regulator